MVLKNSLYVAMFICFLGTTEAMQQTAQEFWSLKNPYFKEHHTQAASALTVLEQRAQEVHKAQQYPPDKPEVLKTLGNYLLLIPKTTLGLAWKALMPENFRNKAAQETTEFLLQVSEPLSHKLSQELITGLGKGMKKVTRKNVPPITQSEQLEDVPQNNLVEPIMLRSVANKNMSSSAALIADTNSRNISLLPSKRNVQAVDIRLIEEFPKGKATASSHVAHNAHDITSGVAKGKNPEVAENKAPEVANASDDAQGALSDAVAEVTVHMINKTQEAFNESLKPGGQLYKAIENLANILGVRVEILLEVVLDRFTNKWERLVAEDGKLKAAIEKTITVTGDVTFRQALRFAILGVLTVAAAGGAFYGLKVMWNQIEKHLKTPRLILESSKKNLWQKARDLFVDPEDLPEMVFPPHLAKRFNNVLATTKKIRQRIKEGHKNIKYRNLLLWGPPGTGKTMFAKMLAKACGMEYAMMSGASFAQFQSGEGVTEMNKLFEWANSSEEGLLIFIDEAESFLGGRVGNDVTKESYQILNNFLNHTGTRSGKFMIVGSTNHPFYLDSAIPSRFDDVIQTVLPEKEERMKILQLYRNTILLDSRHNATAFIESVKKALPDNVIIDIAEKTNGLSGRELSGIMNMLVSDAAVTDSGLLTRELIDDVVQQAIEKNHAFAKTLRTLSIETDPALEAAAAAA